MRLLAWPPLTGLLDCRPTLMRFLVLGGTLFIGRAVTEAALARGHTVTHFTRGRTNTELFAECEQLRGDRDGNLEALRGRDWDACVDTSGYVPRVVGATADLLADHVGHYIFVSSLAAYRDLSGYVDEESPKAQLAEPSEDVGRYYGPLKAACENVLDEAFGERVAHVHPYLVVGPYDATGRFSYWLTRIAAGGRVLAPAIQQQQCKFIDVRDLGAFIVTLAERAAGGAYCVAGPREPVTFGDVIDTVSRMSGSKAEIVWAPEEFLHEYGVIPWTEMPLWPGDERAHLYVNNTKALGTGLELRILEETIVDTLAWALADPQSTYQPDPGRKRARPGLLPERERELISLLGQKQPKTTKTRK